MVVGRDDNNHVLLIAWAIVEKKTNETWSWYIEQLSTDFPIGDGPGWSLANDMQ